MATKTVDETTGCTFQWRIENVSHCWLKRYASLCSPVFTADVPKGTKWKLILYPMGYNHENILEFYLSRQKDDTGIDTVKVNYMLTFVDQDGSILQEIDVVSNKSFNKECHQGSGFRKSLSRDKVFVSERDAFLPEDTLTVQCTLWEKGEKPVKTQQLYGRTIIEVNRRSFLRRMEEFSTLKSGLQGKFNDALIDFEFFLNEGLYFEKKLGIKVNSAGKGLKYFSFKASVVDSAGGKDNNCGTHEYFEEDLSRGVWYTLLFTKKLMENKSHYLPNDVLTLDCECVYSKGTYSHEYCDFLMIPPDSKNEVVASMNDRTVAKEESRNASDLARDLKSIYNDGHFTNTTLRTSTKTFSAHKVILSARSPVFRSMFSNDMKEKSSGHVDMNDFEDDTIHRMLLYMYTDSVEDLQFKSAFELFKIADKYQIVSLKSRCSSFLKEHLCPTNVCEVLVLADLHCDDDLKSAVQDYLSKQCKQFFCSQEWKDLMKTHIQLAADVMHKKMCQE